MGVGVDTIKHPLSPEVAKRESRCRLSSPRDRGDGVDQEKRCRSLRSLCPGLYIRHRVEDDGENGMELTLAIQFLEWSIRDCRGSRNTAFVSSRR